MSLAGENWRGEAMAIAGNLSLHPDSLRERGAAATVEVTVAPRAVVGLSGLAVRSSATPAVRQAWAATARLAPVKPLALFAELDLLLSSSHGGHASWLQADLETLQGVHLVGAFETLHEPSTDGTSTGIWGGVAWFVFPHLDVRADWIRRSPADSFLVQINGYL